MCIRDSIRTDKAGIRQAYLGIHIGAVHIYLRTAGVYNVADFHNFRFKDTVCGDVYKRQGYAGSKGRAPESSWMCGC